MYFFGGKPGAIYIYHFKGMQTVQLDKGTEKNVDWDVKPQPKPNPLLFHNSILCLIERDR